MKRDDNQELSKQKLAEQKTTLSNYYVENTSDLKDNHLAYTADSQKPAIYRSFSIYQFRSN